MGTMRLAGGVVAALVTAGLLVPLAARSQSPSSTQPQSVRGPITAAEAEEIVQAHNAWRRRAGVPSLRWARDLATQAHNRAQELASQGCILEHGTLPDDVGENLYWSSPRQVEGRRDEFRIVSPIQVVAAWGAESDDYSAATSSCAPGRECGHYTQIVWPSTEEVGCGMAVCPSLGQVWVCRYRPRGNLSAIR